MYGFKKHKYLKDADIEKIAAKNQIPLNDLLVLDSTYKGFLRQFDTLLHAATIQNHYQPLQVLYFNKKGELLSFHANCFAGGFPNLNWTRDNHFQHFPPQTAAPLDSIFPLEKLLNFTRKTRDDAAKINLNNSNFYVLVYWNRFLGRQSKRLIKLVQQNAKLHPQEKVQIIYINNDNFFLEQGIN